MDLFSRLALLSRKNFFARIAIAFSLFCLIAAHAAAHTQSQDVCPRPAIGSIVADAPELRSQGGVLKVDFTYHDFTDRDGHVRYCYIAEGGSESPTLRLHPGDTLILSLKNDLTADLKSSNPTMDMVMQSGDPKSTLQCPSSHMTARSTNLHFHGLTVPPVCHQDEVLHTFIQPGDPPFEYRFQIPADEPPGLYWYHPHVHGFSKVQVLGGASGALIIEGIERANASLAGLPERVFVIRDQDLMNPKAQPSNASSAQMPPIVLDHDGDDLNTGTGTGTPAKDLSINFVPVPYPDYPPAVIQMKPQEKQLWRVLNASALTYLNLEVVFNGAAQALGVVALDGVPVNWNGSINNLLLYQNHLGVPPGGRVEFVVTGPPASAEGSLVTRSVNTGWAGENDPNRPIAKIVASTDAPEPSSKLSASPVPLPPPKTPWLENIQPVHVRKLYFSEVMQNPKDPNSPTTYFITVDGQTPKAFDPDSTVPNIVAHQGDVEDWVIENRTQEVHAFHIHQLHFLLLDFFGLPVDEPFLRDTVNVPFWDGKSKIYPSIRVRMDFRDPNIIGTFVYHCHILEHEDGGMMGTIRVDPAEK